MTKFSANAIYSDASDFDKLLFNNGQQGLMRDLNDFVEQFETRQELLELNTLAKTYVDLTTCEPKITATMHNLDLASTLERVTDTQKTLESLLQAVQDTQSQPKKIPFEQERRSYLAELDERKRKLALEMTRESDKLDEFYTKKTRESIYRNLVGSNHQWLQS